MVPAILQTGRDDIPWKNAIGGLRDPGFDHDPVGMIGGVRPIHQIDRLLSLCNRGIFPTACEIEAEARERLPGRFDFRAFHMRIEIVVDRGAIDDAGDLIVLVVVIERVEIERQRAIKQRVLRTDLERVYKFWFERKRVNGIARLAKPFRMCQEDRARRICTAGFIAMRIRPIDECLIGEIEFRRPVDCRAPVN